MDTTLLVFGIKATLRAAAAGVELYVEHARDHKVFLPNLELPKGSRSVQLHRFLMENPRSVSDYAELAEIWDDANKELKTIDSYRIDAAYAIMLQYKAECQLIEDGQTDNESTKHEAKIQAAGRMIEQWREDKEPPSALIRMALTLTDIGLEFVVKEPSILGIGSRGEKLVVAFAENMSAIIPDDVGDFGTKTDFADRVLGIFLRAGLGTLANNASTVIKDEDVARLLKGVTKPIVEALPKSITEQIHYRDFVDVLAGPSAEAAFRLLAENTETSFGKDFANDKALGAVTSALFQAIKATTQDGSIVDILTEQGVIRLYQAGLGVAIERPGLFVGDDTSVKTEMFRDLLSGAAGTLQKHPRFKGPVGASFAAMVLEAVCNNGPAFLKLNPDEPWEKVALTVLDQITSGFAEALKDLDSDGEIKGALRSFSDRQLFELGRVILVQVTQTPGMVGIHRTEVQAIVTGVATAMAEDDNLLLSSDEWIKIAGIAAQKAAANPGRLFSLSTDTQVEALAVKVIKSVLRSAGDTWTADGRSGGTLLFGETLEAVIVAAIKALAGNISALKEQPDLVEQYLRILSTKALHSPEKFGSEGLLNVFSAFIGSVLATGTFPTVQDIEIALSAQEA